MPQGGDEGRRLPMSEGDMSDQSLAAFTTAVAGRHIGRSPGLVDEHELARVEVGLLRAPCRPRRLNVRPILLRGM